LIISNSMFFSRVPQTGKHQYFGNWTSYIYDDNLNR